jgi:type VI secretion system protein ImpK
MPPDDPFFDDIDPERTIIRPMPGRQGAPTQAEPRQVSREAVSPVQPRQAAFSGVSTAGSFDAMLGRSINPLVDAASGLLVLATQLRNTTSHADVEGLRNFAVQSMKKFEVAANDGGYAKETVLSARYVLCVFVDESVLGTPWGGESLWGAESLLSTFHNETWGGEKFFVLLDRLLQQAAAQRDLLELFYICLALGFRGKYGVAQMGLSQLGEIQSNLYRTIVNLHGDFERELSPHWVGEPDKRNILERYIPLWVVATLAGVLLLVLFSGFRVMLNGTSNPVIEGLDILRHGATTVIETKVN